MVSSLARACWAWVSCCWAWATCVADAPDGMMTVYDPAKPIDPPTCTVVARLVCTTAAVAAEPLLPPDDEAVGSWLPLADAAATPPATAPPIRAPAIPA